MPTALSPIRIARARRASFQNTEETFEIDFGLGLRQGLEIYAVHFGFSEAVIVPASGAEFSAQIYLSLHAEVGALEGAIDAFPTDDVILNSEILAEAVYQVQGLDDPATEFRAARSEIWVKPPHINFLEVAGQPLTVASNLTFRAVTSEAILTCNGGQATLFYRYVSLTNAELVEQFVLRR